MRDQLQNGALVSSLGFSGPAIGALIERHMGGEDMGRKLFALTALEQWAQQYA